MSGTPDRPVLAGARGDVTRLLREHGLSPRRALGQNFLVEPLTAKRIAALAELEPGRPVVEVGAGLGSLTYALIETGAKVTAVEIDARLTPILAERVEPLGVRVVLADALRLDWPGLLAGDEHWSLVANLPYNVATPLVLRLLEEAAAVDRFLVMMQAEVAERLAAGVGHPAHGGVSIRVAYWADAHVVGTVPPQVFLPRPRVESALVRLVRHLPDPDIPYRELVEVVRAGFGQRRKTLRRSLSALVPVEAIRQCSVRPEARAEELDLREWGTLARWLASNRLTPS